MSQENERTERVHAAFDLMLRTTRLHHRIVDKLFGDTGLPRSQRKILLYLSRSGEIPSQREIARHFDISPACVARMLKSLASEGFITRTGDEDDLRRNQVRIAEKGTQTVSETLAAFERIDARMFQGFSDEEIRHLSCLLGRIHENLHACEAKIEENKMNRGKDVF